MALIEQWLRDRLINDPTLNELLGEPDSQPRIYPVWAPQADSDRILYPYVVFMRIGTNRQYCSGSDGNESDGAPKVLFHVNCFDKDYFNVKLVEDAVRYAIDGARTPQGVNGFQVLSAFIRNEYDIPEPVDVGDEFPIFAVQFEVEIIHTEKVPIN